MKTLIILSHPEVENSSSQQFLLASAKPLEDVTIHHLEAFYATQPIDKAYEQQLLTEHDRIIFQFPLYWYSAPSLLKEWQDVVLETNKKEQWQQKEFGLVVGVGVAEKEYQAGGREHFQLDELLRPYQAMARLFDWTYLPVFGVYQFDYLSEIAKQKLLIRYQQYLTIGNQTSLSQRTQWFETQFEALIATKTDAAWQHRMSLVKESIEQNKESIEELTLAVKELGEW